MKRFIKHTILFAILSVIWQPSLYAQNQAILETSLLYRTSHQFGLNLNSSGLGGLMYRRSWHKTDKVKRVLDIELLRVRDPKEYRIYGASDNPQQYTFGRLNMAFFLRTGYGNTIKLTDRPYKNAVGLSFNYHYGISTALLKPIFLDVFYPHTDRSGGFVKVERYDPQIHTNPNLIFGNASFFSGISNTSAQFGGYGRASLAIDWGQYPEDFHTLEAGITLDYFPEGLPLMAKIPERNLFFLLYIGYTFGMNK